MYEIQLGAVYYNVPPLFLKDNRIAHVIMRSNNLSIDNERSRSYSSGSTHEKNEIQEFVVCGETNDDKSLRRIETRHTIISVLEDRINQTIYNEDGIGNLDDIMQTEDALPTKDGGLEFQKIDPELVTWNGEDDPQNPKNWSYYRKWRSMGVVSLYTFFSPFSSTMLSPAVSSIAVEFGVTNSIVLSLMVSVYLLAWAIFSPLIAPLSEMYGRKKVLNISVWLLFAFNIGCAFSKNATQMCILRFFAGVGGCAPICIGLGVLSDLFESKQLSTANTIYALGPVFGPCLAAMISGIMLDHVHWRWCFYVLCMANGVCAVFGTIFLEETYSPTLLTQKTKLLRKETGNKNLKCIYDIANGETAFEKIYLNLRRPIELLFTNPMVFGLGIFMAITFGCLYILIVTFPSVWKTSYNMSSTQIGLMYLSLLVGYLVATLTNQPIANYLQDFLKKRNSNKSTPEHRLVLLVQSGIFIPVGLFWYGWGAEKKIYFIFPAVGAGIFGFSLILVFFSISLYLIEMNPRFAASSLAAVSIFRSVLGFGFPLFAPDMFTKLGYGWACSVFGFIALITGVPFPIFLIYYGERMRSWTNRRIEMQQAKRESKYLARLMRKTEIETNQIRLFNN